MEVAE
jgi:pyruvate/2-oxoglutarate dehydrogenase complex dihydrolipoamide dehydrogenase (E3) component